VAARGNAMRIDVGAISMMDTPAVLAFDPTERPANRLADGRFAPGVMPAAGRPWPAGVTPNPHGSIAPAVRGSTRLLNAVGRAMDCDAVRERVRDYVQRRASAKDLIALATKMLTQGDLREAAVQACALVGLSIAELASIVRTAGGADAEQLAAVIEVDAVESAPAPTCGEKKVEQPNATSCGLDDIGLD